MGDGSRQPAGSRQFVGVRESAGSRRFVGFAVGSGCAVAVQSRINATLGVRLDDALLAAWISFASGLLVVAAVVLLSASARTSVRRSLPASRPDPIRWWYLIGGVGGASAVASSTFVVPRVGVAAFTVVLVCGQVVGGLLVDRAGLGTGGRRPVTPTRAGAAVLAVAAVAVAALGEEVAGRSEGSAGAADAASGSWPVPVLLGLAALAGVAVSAQQGVNARLRKATGHAMVATLVNFIGGTLALTGALVAVAVASGTGVVGGTGGTGGSGGAGVELPGEAWLYLGGVIGVGFIALNAIVVPVIGVLRQSIAVLVGMLTGAVALDAVMPAAQMPPVAAIATSVALAVGAVLLLAREERSVVNRVGV